VIEIADVFRRFADDYLLAHGATMLPSHRRAIADILACRTEALGGHLWRCDHCNTEVYSYHSCKNRSCPKCHTEQTEHWLAARKAEVLPCPYFHVTITVPEELRDTLRANQKDGYTLLMKATAEAIIEAGPRSALCRPHRRHSCRSCTPGRNSSCTTPTSTVWLLAGVSDDGQEWHPHAMASSSVRGLGEARTR